VCVLLGAPKVTVRFEGKLWVVSQRNRMKGSSGSGQGGKGSGTQLFGGKEWRQGKMEGRGKSRGGALYL
jgi:hypothetical protein